MTGPKRLGTRPKPRVVIIGHWGDDPDTDRTRDQLAELFPTTYVVSDETQVEECVDPAEVDLLIYGPSSETAALSSDHHAIVFGPVDVLHGPTPNTYLARCLTTGDEFHIAGEQARFGGMPNATVGRFTSARGRSAYQMKLKGFIAARERVESARRWDEGRVVMSPASRTRRPALPVACR